jgi:hypothetical protein
VWPIDTRLRLRLRDPSSTGVVAVTTTRHRVSRRDDQPHRCVRSCSRPAANGRQAERRGAAAGDLAWYDRRMRIFLSYSSHDQPPAERINLAWQAVRARAVGEPPLAIVARVTLLLAGHVAPGVLALILFGASVLVAMVWWTLAIVSGHATFVSHYNLVDADQIVVRAGFVPHLMSNLRSVLIRAGPLDDSQAFSANGWTMAGALVDARPSALASGITYPTADGDFLPPRATCAPRAVSELSWCSALHRLAPPTDVAQPCRLLSVSAGACP